MGKILTFAVAVQKQSESAHGIDNDSEKKKMKEFSNNDVYKFLKEECRQYKTLWEKYGDGIASYTTHN